LSPDTSRPTVSVLPIVVRRSRSLQTGGDPRILSRMAALSAGTKSVGRWQKAFLMTYVSRMVHIERHRTAHIGWLRAAVLGANDGLISTSSLVVGVASAQTTRGPVLLTALAGLVAGALSMAAGEYVSVSSQADTEKADLARERGELATQPETEHAELANIYVARGLAPTLAVEVATQLMAHDALGAHARDELGLSDLSMARPLQAALASAASFAAGAALPLLVVLSCPIGLVVPVTIGASLLLLGLLGAVAARLGGAAPLRGALRVTFWGAVAMGVTALIGHLFGSIG